MVCISQSTLLENFLGPDSSQGLSIVRYSDDMQILACIFINTWLMGVINPELCQRTDEQKTSMFLSHPIYLRMR